MNERIFDVRLADRVAADDPARRERLKAVARMLVGVVRDGLVRDGIVRIHGFGTFQLRAAAARSGINPQTGERIRIPARQRVMFRPAKALRERVDPGPVTAVTLGEPRPSREAMLAASGVPATAAAGAVPASGDNATEPADVPVAAAAIADPIARTTESRSQAPGGDRDEDAGSGGASAPAIRPVPATTRTAGDATAGEVWWVANDEPAADRAGEVAAGPQPPRRRKPLILFGLGVLVAVLVWLLWPVQSPIEPPVVRDESAVEPADPDPMVPETAETPAASEAPAAAEPQAPADPDAAAPENAETPAAPEASATAEAETPTDPDPMASGTAEATVASEAPAPTEPEVPDDPGAAAPETAETPAAPEAPATAEAETPTDPDPVAPGTAEATASSEAPADAEAALPEITETPVASASAPEATESVVPPAAEPPSTLAEIVAGLDRGIELPAAPVVQPAAGAPTDPAAAAAGEPFFAATRHVVEPGDTLWGLAERNYVNPYYWPHIYNHNRQGVADPDRIAVDQQLMLPALQGEPFALTAADRRSIAEGYMRLYRFWQEHGYANAHYALVGVRYFDVEVMPDELAASGAGHPTDTMSAIFHAQLTSRFGSDR